MATVAETFAVALQCHQSGDLSLAEQYYHAILRADPGHADSHHLLGVIAFQRGQHDQALALIRQALALNPHSADFLTNLGSVYHALGQLDEATVCFRRALQINPQLAETQNNLGNILLQQQKLEEAVGCYQQALRLQPQFADASYNLGVVRGKQGQMEAAVAHYRQALHFNPGHVEAHNNLAGALSSEGKWDEAVAHWHEALRLRPDYTEAYSNLGKALQNRGRLDEAARSFRAAVRLQPSRAELHNDLGNVLRLQGKLEDAAEALHQALALQPRFAEALNVLAAVFQRQNRLDEAIGCYRQALDLRPDFFEAHHDLGVALLAQGRIQDAMASYRHAWNLRPDMNALASSVLWCLNFDPDAEPKAVIEEHRRWGRQVESAIPRRPHVKDVSPERRLRIGYVSPDLRRHPVMRYFEPVLAHHDPTVVEAFCYAEVASPDIVTMRSQQLAHQWRWTCGLTDAQVAEQIRADRIDILVDLAGHTGNNRLGVFAHKPAPVQATWLGYLNTIGLTALDYRLTDDILDPPNLPPWGVEQPARLPGGFCCFAVPEEASDPMPLPALRRGHLTFGSLHGLLKLNAKVFDLWSRVLTALPTARLLMFRDKLTGTALDGVRRQFNERGIGDERLDLRQGTDAPGYLKVYEEIDVSLDTLPWSGGVTTCESLWMGVPVLSLRGTSPAGRNAAALLSRVGLSDWAVDSPEEFVTLAVDVSNNLDRLARLREQLRDRVLAGLCDATRLTRELEAAYRTMWRRWCVK